MSSFIDYTVNGLVIGNIYALLAVGLALIFGVANLINFAHGSVYTIGAYVGWAAITFLHTPLPVTMAIVFVACALLGVLIERVGLRPLQGYARIAPLLATIGISFVLDQLVQLVFSPDPRAVAERSAGLAHRDRRRLDRRARPADRRRRPRQRRRCCSPSCASPSSASRCARRRRIAKRRSRWASTSTPSTARSSPSPRRSAASAACWSACITTTSIPAMSFQATLKGVVAQVIGGVGNVPGAIVGSLLLGLIESYGIALFGTTYRNLFAFVLLIAVPALAAQRPVRRPLGAADRAADRHLHRAEPAGPRCRAGRSGRSPCAAFALPLVDRRALSAADADQRLARGDARAQPDPDRGHGRADFVRPCRPAGDRRLCLGAAGGRSRRADDRCRFPPPA